MKVHKARLADIEVEEISHVDRAANKRKFLFKKSHSEDNEGGENLELLKAFKEDKGAIEALEGIEANLVKFDAVLAKRLEDPKLTAETKALLLSKKEEYEDLKAKLEDGFEQLFLDKAAKDAEDDEDAADGGADEDAEGEADGEEAEPEDKKGKGKGKFPFKGKKKVAKSDDEAEDEDDSEDEESEEESEDTTVEKSDDAEDEAEDESEEGSDEESDDDETDAEDEAVMAEITKELQKGETLRKELRELTAPKKS